MANSAFLDDPSILQVNGTSQDENLQHNFNGNTNNTDSNPIASFLNSSNDQASQPLSLEPSNALSKLLDSAIAKAAREGTPDLEKLPSPNTNTNTNHDNHNETGKADTLAHNSSKAEESKQNTKDFTDSSDFTAIAITTANAVAANAANDPKEFNITEFLNLDVSDGLDESTSKILYSIDYLLFLRELPLVLEVNKPKLPERAFWRINSKKLSPKDPQLKQGRRKKDRDQRNNNSNNSSNQDRDKAFDRPLPPGLIRGSGHTRNGDSFLNDEDNEAIPDWGDANGSESDFSSLNSAAHSDMMNMQTVEDFEKWKQQMRKEKQKDLGEALNDLQTEQNDVDSFFSFVKTPTPSVKSSNNGESKLSRFSSFFGGPGVEDNKLKFFKSPASTQAQVQPQERHLPPGMGPVRQSTENTNVNVNPAGPNPNPNGPNGPNGIPINANVNRRANPNVQSGPNGPSGPGPNGPGIPAQGQPRNLYTQSPQQPPHQILKQQAQGPAQGPVQSQGQGQVNSSRGSIPGPVPGPGQGAPLPPHLMPNSGMVPPPGQFPPGQFPPGFPPNAQLANDTFFRSLMSKGEGQGIPPWMQNQANQGQGNQGQGNQNLGSQGPQGPQGPPGPNQQQPNNSRGTQGHQGPGGPGPQGAAPGQFYGPPGMMPFIPPGMMPPPHFQGGGQGGQPPNMRPTGPYIFGQNPQGPVPNQQGRMPGQGPSQGPQVTTQYR